MKSLSVKLGVGLFIIGVTIFANSQVGNIQQEGVFKDVGGGKSGDENGKVGRIVK